MDFKLKFKRIIKYTTNWPQTLLENTILNFFSLRCCANIPRVCSLALGYLLNKDESSLVWGAQHYKKKQYSYLYSEWSTKNSWSCILKCNKKREIIVGFKKISFSNCNYLSWRRNTKCLLELVYHHKSEHHVRVNGRFMRNGIKNW